MAKVGPTWPQSLTPPNQKGSDEVVTVIDKYRRWSDERTELYNLMAQIERLEKRIENLDADHHPKHQARAMKLMGQHSRLVQEASRLSYTSTRQAVTIGDELANTKIKNYVAIGIGKKEAQKWQAVGLALKGAASHALKKLDAISKGANHEPR